MELEKILIFKILESFEKDVDLQKDLENFEKKLTFKKLGTLAKTLTLKFDLEISKF